MIPNNYKRVQPGCNNDNCTADYVEPSQVVVVIPEIHNAAGTVTTTDVDGSDRLTMKNGRAGARPSSSGANDVLMVHADVIIAPKDSDINNYGTTTATCCSETTFCISATNGERERLYIIIVSNTLSVFGTTSLTRITRRPYSLYIPA